MKFHLSQANVGRIRAPLEDPSMDGFRLEPRVNAVAGAAGEASRGRREVLLGTGVGPTGSRRCAASQLAVVARAARPT